MIKKSNGEESVSRALVFRWHKKFSEGCKELTDEPKSGRRKSVSVSSLTSLKSALEGDRRLTIRELADRADVSIGTAYKLITRDLGMRKVRNVLYL